MSDGDSDPEIQRSSPPEAVHDERVALVSFTFNYSQAASSQHHQQFNLAYFNSLQD